MRRCGRRIASSTRCRAAARAAACTSPPTAARPGPRSRAIPALPSGMVGRIGVAITKADSNRVYALVENENGGLFVSDDAGASWKLMNAARAIRQRAFYYTHVFGDPSNKDVVYMQNTSLFRSTDAGKTTVQVGQDTHGDHHDLWVDPDDPNHVVDGNDGGGAITYNISVARAELERPGLPDRAVVPRGHHRAPAVPRVRLAAGQQHAVRAEQHQRAGRRLRRQSAGGAVPGGRRRARLHRAASDRPGRLLRRHQQRLVPDAPQPPHRRAQGSRRLPALLLRRAVEGRQGALAVDLPDHLFATSIRTCSTRARSACGSRPTAATRGRRSAAT